ncbi:MAG: putative outer membrane protein [Rhodobacteraceae bacterium HLUCCA08]|nr:MAG: putative outer membrane protein [Rhodobacteraceae bacterium HLUCCA08]
MSVRSFHGLLAHIWPLGAAVIAAGGHIGVQALVGQSAPPAPQAVVAPPPVPDPASAPAPELPSRAATPELIAPPALNRIEAAVADAVAAAPEGATDTPAPASPQAAPAGMRAQEQTHGHATDLPDARSPCVAELQVMATRTRLYFANGSARLDDQAQEAARTLAAQVAGCPQARVTIIGFADPSGDPARNVALSWERAHATLDVIAAAGHATDRFAVASHMQDHPDGVHPQFDVVDRRVDFEVSDAAAP